LRVSEVRRRHHPVVRITHWVNAIALTIMIGSGLRIFNAYPAFARKGDTFCCYPFEGDKIPSWLTFGGWLAGARNWHFAMMWVLVANGLVYLGFVYLHGEWRDLVPRRGILHGAWQMTRFYLALRRDHPAQGKHNALQRLAYFSMPVIAIASVLSGLAIWKPVQLAPLTAFATRRAGIGAVNLSPPQSEESTWRQFESSSSRTMHRFVHSSLYMKVNLPPSAAFFSLDRTSITLRSQRRLDRSGPLASSFTNMFTLSRRTTPGPSRSGSLRDSPSITAPSASPTIKRS
jgi:thiosulfate reductase cytochrome b subunit